MKTHKLKIHPVYFNAIKDGKKNFEVRNNDRDFQLGDIVILEEFNGSEYTGNVIRVKIKYILDDNFEGLTKGYVVFAFTILDYNC